MEGYFGSREIEEAGKRSRYRKSRKDANPDG